MNVKRSKSETARNLAKAHFANEPNLRHIHLLEPLNEHDPRDPIKLLEVVEGTIERGIEPIAFPADPARGVEYPVLIVEVSPSEYEAIRSNIGGLISGLQTHGWSMGSELPAG
jgi:hypothetical protein